MTAAQWWLQQAAVGALMWPVALLQYGATLDNAWVVVKERAIQAGKLLAEALCDHESFGTCPG